MCPKCGSPDIERLDTVRRRCVECGYRYVEQPDYPRPTNRKPKTPRQP